jgi:D-alanyl-D-alanine carboxypeptidase
MPRKKVTPNKKKRIVSVRTLIILICVVVFLVVIGFVLLPRQLISAELAKILENEWNAYKSDKSNFKGGLAMQILSPKGDYFIATGMGEGMNNSYHFRTASVSKTFTAAAIMLLQQRGLLNINDKITDNIPGTNTPYLPDTEDYNVPYKQDITIRMLLMHRAGIFDVSNNVIPENQFSQNKLYVGQSYLDYQKNIDPNHTFTFDELVGVVARNQLSFFQPGSAYHYSDTGYSMLGKIIEQVSKKSFANFVKTELLVPNGLNDTIVVSKGSDQTLPTPFVTSYYWTDGNNRDVTFSNMSPHVAEGSMTTTPRDLANWAKKLFTGQAGLSKDIVAQMMDACMSTGGEGTTAGQYGLGLLCSKNGYGHNGAHEAYLSNMVYNPKTGVAYVIFTNSWNCQTCSKNIDSLKGELKAMDVVTNKVLQKLGY